MVSCMGMLTAQLGIFHVDAHARQRPFLAGSAVSQVYSVLRVVEAFGNKLVCCAGLGT